MHGILGKSRGMPIPEAAAVLEALRAGLPVLKEEVKGRTGMVACLDAVEHWLLCGGGTKRVEAVAKAVPQCMEVMWEADVLHKDVCLNWWENRRAANTAVKETADAAMDKANKLNDKIKALQAAIDGTGMLQEALATLNKVCPSAALHFSPFLSIFGSRHLFLEPRASVACDGLRWPVLRHIFVHMSLWSPAKQLVCASDINSSSAVGGTAHGLWRNLSVSVSGFLLG